MISHLLLVCLVAALLLASLPSPAVAAEPVIFDTDIGTDVDDAYALALLVSLPEAHILGVTTTFGETDQRAQLAAKLLNRMGRRDIPVFAGRMGPKNIGSQAAWAKGYTSPAIKKMSAVAFMKREIEKRPGRVTLIAVGPLTNLGDLFTQHPEVRTKIKQIVIMGGAVYVDYNNKPPAGIEWNIRCDPKAARAVYESGVPLVMAGLEVTTMMRLEEALQKRLAAYGTRTTDALAALTLLWEHNVPVLYDPVAVAYALGHRFCDAEQKRVVVDDDGRTRIVEGAPNVTVLINPRQQEFLDWYVRTVGERG